MPFQGVTLVGLWALGKGLGFWFMVSVFIRDLLHVFLGEGFLMKLPCSAPSGSSCFPVVVETMKA